MTEGQCEYIYRMQSTVDHTDVEKLAGLLGAKFVEPEKGVKDTNVCKDANEAGLTKA